MGRNTESLAAIGTALAQAPDSAHYWHVKGRILSSLGDCNGAAALEKSVCLDPGYTLPYPGFGSAQGNIDALKTSCRPTATAPSATAKSSLAMALAIAAPGAVMALGKRR